jgi:hypothetical protein
MRDHVQKTGVDAEEGLENIMHNKRYKFATGGLFAFRPVRAMQATILKGHGVPSNSSLRTTKI